MKKTHSPEALITRAGVVLSFQDYEKPSPPQKPLPADPLGRGSRLPAPIPTAPRPPPSIPLPSRSARDPQSSSGSGKMMRITCCYGAGNKLETVLLLD